MIRIHRRLRLFFGLTLLLVTLTQFSCSAPQPADEEVVTVEGAVSVRGNHPFTAVLLETSENTQYVLKIAGRDESGFYTPSHARVRGRLYTDEWDGRRVAHIEVHEWEMIDAPGH